MEIRPQICSMWHRMVMGIRRIRALFQRHCVINTHAPDNNNSSKRPVNCKPKYRTDIQPDISLEHIPLEEHSCSLLRHDCCAVSTRRAWEKTGAGNGTNNVVSPSCSKTLHTMYCSALPSDLVPGRTMPCRPCGSRKMNIITYTIHALPYRATSSCAMLPEICMYVCTYICSSSLSIGPAPAPPKSSVLARSTDYGVRLRITLPCDVTGISFPCRSRKDSCTSFFSRTTTCMYNVQRPKPLHLPIRRRCTSPAGPKRWLLRLPGLAQHERRPQN